jgi:magnesium chelatase family protein
VFAELHDVLNMSFYTFHRQGLNLEFFEVECSFLPGLPRIHLSGLPDTAAKESLLRVRSALLSAQYQLPNHEQVILNLKPAYIKKQSRGIDLAIAMSYLWNSGQLINSVFTKFIESKSIKNIFVYGELSLSGEVTTPDDLDFLDRKVLSDDHLLITGPLNNDLKRRFVNGKYFELGNINELLNSQIEGEGGGAEIGTGENSSDGDHKDSLIAVTQEIQKGRPEIANIYFSKEAAELMSLVAAGEHSLLLVGPSGTGKTTFMDSIYACLKDPTADEFFEIKKLAKVFGLNPTWRPFVAPHHSATSISVIGGGLPPEPGEITRAHGGILYLDEFLEFENEVKEALREPVEKHEIRISRKGTSIVFPARILLLATSNLCPCGDLVPNGRTSCSFSLVKCRSYMNRLSGPMLDRFEVLVSSHTWGKNKNVTLSEISARAKKAVEFALISRGQTAPNSQISMIEIEKSVDPFTLKELLPPMPSSIRRRQALLKVARTYADLEASDWVKPSHIEVAKRVCIQAFDELRRTWN